MRSHRSLAAGALFGLLVLSLLGFDAATAQSGSLLLVRQVDTVDPARSTLQFLSTAPQADATSARLTENGQSVDATTAPLPDETPINVALLFDTSASMDGSGALVAAKDAVKRWVRGRTAGEKQAMRFAIYTMSDTATVIQGFTADEARLVEAIDRVAPARTEAASKKTALWKALRLAGDDLVKQKGQPNIVVMTAQADNVGPAGEDAAARGSIGSSKAAVFALTYTGAGMTDASMRSMVDRFGGTVLTTDQGPQMGELLSTAGEMISDQQYVVSYRSNVAVGEVARLNLEVGGSTTAVDTVVGSLTVGKQALQPVVTSSSGGITFLQSGLGLAVAILLVVVAVSGLAYGVTLLLVKDDDLSAVLRPYAEPAGGADEDDSSLIKTQFVQRAVEITEQMAADRGLLASTESALERANLPLRAGEALFFYAAVVVVVTLLGLAWFGSLIGGIILGAFAAVIPIATVRVLAAMRKKKFMSQLPDTLQLLSGTLKAGYSLMQGVEAVSQEVEDPMGIELRRVVTEARLGRPLEEALEGTAQRMDSNDFAWAVMAIRIQREVGGNLSELLLTVAETMTARERLRRDVAALTAEGRVSAIVLGILPLGLALAMYVLNPEYISRLFNTGLGNVLLGAAVVSMGIGFAWMRKIINIEI